MLKKNQDHPGKQWNFCNILSMWQEFFPALKKLWNQYNFISNTVVTHKVSSYIFHYVADKQNSMVSSQGFCLSSDGCKNRKKCLYRSMGFSGWNVSQFNWAERRVPAWWRLPTPDSWKLNIRISHRKDSHRHKLRYRGFFYCKERRDGWLQYHNRNRQRYYERYSGWSYSHR